MNDGAARIGSMREFAERASDLGAELRIAKMAWPSGLAVLGFYLGGDSGLDGRPLICLNGAHHPAAIATAFLHEVGHHVTAKLFSNRDESVQLSRHNRIRGASRRSARAGRRRPREPRNVSAQPGRAIVRPGVPSKEHRERGASRSKRRPLRKPSPPPRAATASTWGSLSIQKMLQYQAGLVHFTRLRQALLDEYGL